MRQKYKSYTQEDFAILLKIDQPRVSRLLMGKDPVSFPLAVRLSLLFPQKNILKWKNATPDDLIKLYEWCRKKAGQNVMVAS